jgi:hypothetical protein
MTTSEFDMKPEALDLDPDAWRNNVVAGVLDSFLEHENGSLYGVFSFKVVCRYGRKRVLSIGATYLASYRIKALVTKVHASFYRASRQGRDVSLFPQPSRDADRTSRAYAAITSSELRASIDRFSGGPRAGIATAVGTPKRRRLPAK